MLSGFSPTEVAFLMAATMQAVAAVVWAIGAWVWSVAEVRRAILHWSAYAGLSALTWTLLALALQSPPLVSILSGVAAALMLQRGIRIFIGRPVSWSRSWIPLAVVAAAYALAENPATRPLQVGINFGVIGWIYGVSALELHAHARGEMQLRLPWLLAMPLALGSLAFLSRAARAVLAPDSVATEMTTHSGLNVASAFSYLVLVMVMHSTLAALVVHRLVGQLRRLSRHDALTGLYNRHAMQEALDLQLHRSRRAGDRFSVLMFDLDHFKLINDSFGHAVGDQALQHVAGVMLRGLRDVDRLARFGGEEFLALLPGLDAAQALALAERIRQAVATERGPQLAPGIGLSVSVGVAEWHGPAEEISRLLVRADAALYTAKRLGRDRVVLAGLASA